MQITESNRSTILDMAKHGFSYACIANKVWGVSRGKPIDSETKYLIRSVLQQENVRLLDYRNGENAISKSIIGALKKRLNVIDALKKAASKSSPTLKLRKVV